MPSYMRLLLKYIFVLCLFAAGILFLLKCFGVATPLVTYKGAETHGVPAGIALLIMGVLLARFWKTSSLLAMRGHGEIHTITGEIRSASLEGDSHTRPPRD
jgi:hypothetical protein